MTTMTQKIPFLDIFVDDTRHATKIKASDYQSAGRSPIIDQGKNDVAGYADFDEGLYENVPSIVFGDHTGIFKYVTEPFFIGADGTKVIKTIRPDVDLRYLYHALRFMELPDGGYSRHYKWLKETVLPLPSEESQQRIARQLDQIEHTLGIAQQMLEKYDELIQSRFVEMFGTPGRPMVELGRVCDFYSGKTPSKQNKEFWNNGNIAWFSPKDMKQQYLMDSQDHITDKAVEETSLNLLSRGTAVIVVRGMILAHDVPVAVLKTEQAAINQDMKALLPNKPLDSTFLMFAVKYQEELLLAETGSSAHGTKKLDTGTLKRLPIPDAPVSEQSAFAEFVEHVEQQKATVHQTIDKLQTLYYSLAQQYFAV